MKPSFYVSVLISFFFFCLCSCSSATKLNMRPHTYGNIPTKIVWIQVPGLTEEHLALFNFFGNPLSLEESRCAGKIWNYNLYELRPSAYSSLLTQVSSKKNLKKECSDYQEMMPIWSKVTDMGLLSAVLEHDVEKEESLEQIKSCSNDNTILRDLILLKMSKSPQNKSDYFHLQTPKSFYPGQIYYDQSCQKGPCFSDLYKNSVFLHGQFTLQNPGYLFIIRDFSYYHALKNHDIKKAKERLHQIDSIFEYFKTIAEQDKHFLLLLTTAAPISFEFPAQGKGFGELEKKESVLFYHQQPLMGTAFAIGAKAENFCGIFEEAEIPARLLPFPSKKEETNTKKP